MKKVAVGLQNCRNIRSSIIIYMGIVLIHEHSLIRQEDVFWLIAQCGWDYLKNYKISVGERRF